MVSSIWNACFFSNFGSQSQMKEIPATYLCWGKKKDFALPFCYSNNYDFTI